jgi:hypothetical protein
VRRQLVFFTHRREYSASLVSITKAMNRPIVTLLMLLMLALQGVAGAGGQTSDSGVQGMEHCDDHEKAGPDCHCCNHAGSMDAGCASLCSAVCVSSAAALMIPHLACTQLIGFSEHWMPSPTYSPPNPPPIS